MYEVSYNGRAFYASNYVYCCIRPEGLLCDVEHDLLTIAKLLIKFVYIVVS